MALKSGDVGEGSGGGEGLLELLADFAVPVRLILMPSCWHLHDLKTCASSFRFKPFPHNTHVLFQGVSTRAVTSPRKCTTQTNIKGAISSHIIMIINKRLDSN